MNSGKCRECRHEVFTDKYPRDCHCICHHIWRELPPHVQMIMERDSSVLCGKNIKSISTKNKFPKYFLK